MASARRFTKKQLDPIHKTEIRKIAVIGMGLGVTDSWTMTEKEIKGWVYDRADDFSSVDFSEEALESTVETWRPGVSGYIAALQKFIKKEGACPEWKSDLETVIQAVEETFAPEEEPAPKATKKARGVKIKKAAKKTELPITEGAAEDLVKKITEDNLEGARKRFDVEKLPPYDIDKMAGFKDLLPKPPMKDLEISLATPEELAALSTSIARIEKKLDVLSNLLLDLSGAFAAHLRYQYDGEQKVEKAVETARVLFSNQREEESSNR